MYLTHFSKRGNSVFLGFPPFKTRTGFGRFLCLHITLKLEIEPTGEDGDKKFSKTGTRGDSQKTEMWPCKSCKACKAEPKPEYSLYSGMVC